jgi:FAD/FMN-containing dehydrogenase
MTALRAIPPPGHEATIDVAAVAAFAARLRRPLLYPGDAGYERACTIWNGMIDKRPALVAQPSGVADTIACVNFAREAGVPLSVRGGGHNIAGSALAEGGLMIDNTPRKGIHVNRDTGVVRIEPGCTWGDADHETQHYGLAVPGGVVTSTGVAGFTLGGGFGWASRKYGLASDNLLSVDIVTANGAHVRASESDHPDLFWAVRGGGGNFGIATSFEFQARPLGPQVVAGIVLHPMERAKEVIALYREITASASDDLCCAFVMRLAPPAPFLDKALHGKPVIGIIACHVGDVDQGLEAVRPIKAFGTPLADVIAPKPFVVHQKMLDAGQPFGRRYYWKSDYFADLDPDMDEVLVAHTQKFLSPHSAVLMFQLGGQTSRVGEHETAAGNRDAAHVIGIQSQWEDAADDEANIAWARGLWQALRRFTTGGTYVNFLTEEETDDRVREAYRAETYDRLAAVKAKYDPDNLFRSNQNIRPKR